MTLWVDPPSSLSDDDFSRARRFVAEHPPSGTVLLCAITGSHLYGFSSPDSDLDLKGIHLAPTSSVLGLEPVQDSHDRLSVYEGVECDLTLHEARRALSLLLGGNGNMLERIFSPLQLFDSPALAELRGLAEGARSRRFHRHYGGFFRGVCREHLAEPAPRAKSLLYGYRVALTGVHFLRSGEVEADVRTLAPMYGFPDVLDLVALKVEGTEKGAVPAEVAALHQANWPRLEALLADALERSSLPPEPTNAAACSEWLVETRRLAW